MKTWSSWKLQVWVVRKILKLPYYFNKYLKKSSLFLTHKSLFLQFFYSPKLVKIQKSCRTWTGKIYISFGRFTGNGEQLGTGVREKKFYRFK